MGEYENRQALERVREAFETGDLRALAAVAKDVYARDIVQEWPQSGERISGLDNVQAVNDNYPAMTGTEPKSSLRRVIGSGDIWIIENTIDYGDGVPVSAVSILEFRDGKVVKQTDYFANPFEAPAWRSQWVQKMEPVRG